ncbi:MAG: ureidoglycolate lyase [Halieaceae bacterium]|jgi:ureidoglycolate lyase
MNLILEPLSKATFADFGEVIERGVAEQVIPINYGMTERHHALAKVDVESTGGRGVISIFHSQPVELPFRIKVMERHPLGSQAFMPLTGNPYVVVVAPAGEFNPALLRAFLAGPDQGVNYGRGTWHHYCLGLKTANDFLVVDRSGEGDNCDEVELDLDTQIYVRMAPGARDRVTR